MNEIYTSCKDCCFTICEDGTQTGCDLDKLDTFKEVIEAYDDDGEFYIIKDEVCSYRREQKWKELAGEEWAEKLYREMKPTFITIVLAEESEKDVAKTVRSLGDQVFVYIISNSVLDESKLRLPPMNWRASQIQSEFNTQDDLINFAVSCIQDRSSHLVVVKAGYEFEPDFFENLSRNMIDINLKYIMIDDEDFQIYHAFTQSIYGLPLKERIEKECPHLLLTKTDLEF